MGNVGKKILPGFFVGLRLLLKKSNVGDIHNKDGVSLNPAFA